SCLGWLPGAVILPGIIGALSGGVDAEVWIQFAISFVVAALFTTVQTFILIERFLTATLYPDFFQDARPADVPGGVRLSFGTRLRLLWAAAAVAPLLRLLVVTTNLPRAHAGSLLVLAVGVTLVGGIAGGLIFFTMGRDLRAWLAAHSVATAQIAQENFDVRLPDKRPDEFGRLSDRFNDMAAALQRAQY